jgi:hypothetical protein
MVAESAATRSGFSVNYCQRHPPDHLIASENEGSFNGTLFAEVLSAVTMDKRSARRSFVSTWMLEFSVLWAVFPLLDQLLSGRFDYKVLALACVMVVIFFWLGWILAGEEDK